ncbi:uncharacterized protein LOC107270893 isoform X2 [Cephus cinctus]|uniref:Uncharacterized protein LOC107270893 isoform X2 n=1 Tax=Cephus cinctus TaxID=211228 RepID=A0AAJ7C5B2_CEPCN|nr:uncharacterized protein LOC107270893 isoform X2 [Cephus cinctus]
MASGAGNVPQWKRDLIQRRRQQSKVLASNGASSKLCSAVIGAGNSSNSSNGSHPQDNNNEFSSGPVALLLGQDTSNTNTLSSFSAPSSTPFSVQAADEDCCPAGIHGSNSRVAVAGATAPVNGSDHGDTPVAINMRLEADLICSDSEDAPRVNRNENDDYEQAHLKYVSKVHHDNDNSSVVEIKVRNKEFKADSTRNSMDNNLLRNRIPSEDGESDSSEELQYGPGIVNKLKSKYLNLTLRETSKSRSYVQRFRRAASLEDLLDCDDEPSDKSWRDSNERQFTKRTAVVKSDRYRNASRGNDSMKRARSVETLLRYNSTSDDVTSHSVPSRSSVKIESRLGETDRPKAINKPKRIKPVLAETERPPPDLVKTTMRIFEGSVKKHKPKGEVAVKVATFKTINDTFKAQNQKKIIPKPPLQPKPFVNGNTKTPGSPKKTLIVQQKPTAEIIEELIDGQEHHNDGVITDPIVQSVSSVVSKFQQIEKSHSPSPSPEPASKLKFSPVPSPEPTIPKLKCSSDTKKTVQPLLVKSPPTSPRISPPRVTSPASPKRETFRQHSTPMQKPPSPSRELFRQSSVPDTKCTKTDGMNTKTYVENISQMIPERIKSPDIEKKDTIKLEEVEEDQEDVDGTKTISKSALDNISKAGTTLQFKFNDKSTINKNYLPGSNQNCSKLRDRIPISKSAEVKTKFLLGTSVDFSVPEESPELSARLQEHSESENIEKKDDDILEVKLIGAISSLALSKNTSNTSHSQINECKNLRCQKVDTISSTSSPPQKQIGIIRPLVSTKTHLSQQNLSNRELEKNLINRVKSIEQQQQQQPTKVVVSLKSAEEIQPVKKTTSSGASAGGGGGLWDAKPWNQQNNTMVFNFSNRKDVPDYIENDGLIIRRKREKPKAGDGGIIVLDSTLDSSTTDEAEWEMTGGPPSPCDVSFANDNVLINGHSNLSRQPRNHKHRIQFDDTATRTFEYPSEASMLEFEGTSVDADTSVSGDQSTAATLGNRSASTSLPSLLGGGGLASYTPSKVDLVAEGFELGVTRALVTTTTISSGSTGASQQPESLTEVDYLKPTQDGEAWGSETTTDMLF